MVSPDLEARYNDLVERLLVANQSSLSRACSLAGLTPTQYLALTAIRRLKSPRMSELSHELSLTPGAATTLVDRLVRLALVERVDDPQDRRTVCLRLSPKGRQAAQKAWGERKTAICRTLERLDNEECNRLLTGLETLVDAWQEES